MPESLTTRDVAPDFSRPHTRRGSASLKWDLYGQDVLPMWVADMDFRAPECVIRALHERIDQGVFGYGLPPAGLPDTVCRWLDTRFGWSVQPSWLVWLPGLVSALNICCRVAGGPGTGVMTTVPVYPPFLSAPANSRQEVVRVPMTVRDGRWLLDLEQMEASCTPDTRLLLFCHPHNPTGRAFERHEMEAVAAFCERHDLLLCSDEIHADFVLDPNRRHLPMAALDERIARRTITLMAPSKTFNIPGLGCAYAVIPDPDLRRRFKGVMRDIVPEANILGFTAALAAYRDGAPWLDALLAYLRKNREIVESAVRDMPPLSMLHPEATYLAWIDAREVAPDPAAFFRNAGVALSDGQAFGAPGYLRLNYGCPESLLREGLERMRKALDHRTGP